MTPTFAVVGHVNKGKSSLVSTLTEDDSVRIEKDPGTTRVCREFPIAVDGRTVFSLYDTPGFEQARAVLGWLVEHEERFPTRRDAVQAFLERHRHSGQFTEECHLLAPVMAGAGILYVVDGSRPFRRQYRAEMEILRWTGQPRMALINQISDRDHMEAWRVELDQYFSIVRTFNAHQVGFAERIRLLRGMRELSEQFRPLLDEAIAALIDERRRRREVARTITRLVSGSLSQVLEVSIPRGDAVEPHSQELQRRFHDALRGLEGGARREVERIYQHSGLVRDEAALEAPVWGTDLFASKTFATLGLAPRQLLVAGTVAGAAAGGGVDAVVGGTSFGTGLLVGALAGGASAAYYSAQNLASVRTLWRGFRGDRVLAIGPHRNPNFPWLLLDRALLHWLAVAERAHARRDPVALAPSDRQGVVARLADDLRRTLTATFTSIRKKAPRVPVDLDDRLRAAVEQALDQLAADEERILRSA